MATATARIGGTTAANRAQRIFASAERKEALDRELELKTAEQVAESLGSMKGVATKLGQMASYLDDGLPEPLRQALASLQQDAPPMSPELAASVVRAELGDDPRSVFAEWDPTPIAAASIGQVHRAMTRDGQAVAVKVQYPGVEEAITADLANTDVLIHTVGMMGLAFEPGPVVEELRERLTEELDYLHEAENQRLFSDLYRGHPFIRIPEVFDALSTKRVLTTELMSGARFSEVAKTWPQEERDLAGEAIDRFVFRSLYRFHAFNGDPHPGNYLFERGGKVAFLDFGLVRRFDDAEMDVFFSMIETLVVRRDLDGFRAALERANVLKPGSAAKISDDEMRDYFSYFYEPILREGPWRFTHEYAAEAVHKLMTYNGSITRHSNMPPAFVLIQRINLGLSAVLAELGATADWRRIGEEMWPFVDAPPSTPMGKAEAEWLANKAAAGA
jgi:predicted unusual protein kinase regulating ubiquinone biosynthesis (AarF/ABC1/UbiB family)